MLRWSGRYLELNGPSDAVRLLRIQAQLDTGDVEGAKTALQARVFRVFATTAPIA